MKVLGLMSGTSLDGLDLALVNLEGADKIEYSFIATKTLEYTKAWQDQLRNAPSLSGKELIELDIAYGKRIGILVAEFLNDVGEKADLIASHGHTVFHEPDSGYTLQIGNGHYIRAGTNVPVVYDFRTADLAQGGQGAPLVPVGDALLFKDYDHCINLGGIANISMKWEGVQQGFDICPFNILLNYYSKELGQAFDEGGQIARKGSLNRPLLERLSSMDYYRQSPPKSLDKEAILKEYIPQIGEHESDIKTILHTLNYHYAEEVSKYILGRKALLTGGGVYNKLFLEMLESRTGCEIVVPDKELIEFKEALVFALLGFLRAQERINVLASVTGGAKDISSGIYLKT